MRIGRRIVLMALVAGGLGVIAAFVMVLLVSAWQESQLGQRRRGPGPTLQAVAPEQREQAIATVIAINASVQQQEAAILAVTTADVEQHADFLAEPNTGIFRLLPRETYDYSDSPRKLSSDGGGAYYSFDCRTHRYGYRTNIGLERGELKGVFYGRDAGLYSVLGNVDLAELTLDDPRVQPLVQLVPENQTLEQRLDLLWEGRYQRAGATTFSERVDADVDTTYLLRSIHDSPEGSDSLVAFRIVRRDRDGSLIIVWKMLKQFALLPEDTKDSQSGCS
ncbi:MAG: hypothetical protein OHK0022_21060 [Roseiflexaceae bacterium]